MKTIFAITLILYHTITFFVALKQAQKNKFFADTKLGNLFSIYVWGDALILAPFWILTGFILLISTWQLWLKLLFIFYTTRSFFEVIYWLNAQAVNKNYKAPLFRNIKWLNAEQATILYQLTHFIVVVIGIWSYLNLF